MRITEINIGQRFVRWKAFYGSVLKFILHVDFFCGLNARKFTKICMRKSCIVLTWVKSDISESWQCAYMTTLLYFPEFITIIMYIVEFELYVSFLLNDVFTS